ncbi:MAG: hypothetical protein DRR08_23670 [Candidatus Parabeggiatoa sp. nov. 2]|nr:MAG: hypothetical protein DRR08_23670 [Gammaproteobacteria bacterium]
MKEKGNIKILKGFPKAYVIRIKNCIFFLVATASGRGMCTTQRRVEIICISSNKLLTTRKPPQKPSKRPLTVLWLI